MPVPLLHQVTGPVPKVDFRLRRMTVREELGQPFEAHLELYCTERSVEGKNVLGKAFVVRVTKPSGSDWHFHGLASRFVNFGSTDYYQVYHVTLRPWNWFLTRAADCRILQNKTIPDILDDVFKTKNTFSDYRRELKETYESLEYCVQYRESDFDFAQRLMESEGIYYYFEHSASEHKLVLCDSKDSHPKLDDNAKLPFRRRMPGFTGVPHIFDWTRAEEVQSGAVAHTDFDFEKPKTSLLTRATGQVSHDHSALERFDYPGEFLTVKAGERYAKIRLDEWQSRFSLVEAQAECHDLAVGRKFEMRDFPRDKENGEYLIVAQETTIESGEIEHLGSDAQNRFEVKLTACSSTQQFRPQRRVPKPIVQGPQTALVVGKEKEEVWTDKYGRVKVQFHWDRVGKSDENSSCWVRVAQVWAGKNWGAMHIPRIGQEVIVDFLEGDPDRPIITGRVYNFDQMPPYALPDNASQSGLKSMSTKEGTKDTFNELRFEDKKGAEQVYFHAERDFERIVENNDTIKVGFETKKQGDRTVQVFNNESVKIGTKDSSDGSQSLTVFNNQTVKVGDKSAKDGSQTIEVWKNRDVTIQSGNDTLTVKQGNLTIQVKAGQCEIEAAKSIELKVGSSSVKIGPSSIEIKSPTVSVKGDAKASVEGAMVSVAGSGMTEVKGGLVKIN